MAFPSLAGQQRSIARIPLNNNSQQGGVEQDTGATNGMFYTPDARGPGQYDFSYMYGGMDALGRAPRYKRQTYNPYQFKSPQVDTVQGPAALGESYYSNLASSASQAALRPLAAQSSERMRQMQQGFGNSLSDAASKEFQLKNSMKYGEDVSGVQGEIQNRINEQKINEQKDINQSNFQERQRVSNLNTAAGLQTAGRQADENYRAAGFGDDSARYEAQDLLSRIQTMLMYGGQLPQLQGNLKNIADTAYNNILNHMGGLTGIGGM